MSKVMTFSRTFPASHPKAGEPTFFVEKILNSVMPKNKHDLINLKDLQPEVKFIVSEVILAIEGVFKHHTIRAGNNWKVGDKFSPRVWSGKPYNSPQITIALDIEIVKVWKFECDIEGVFYLDGKWIDVTSSELPENDGLDTDDLLDWFPVGKVFSGQILCWNKDIKY